MEKKWYTFWWLKDTMVFRFVKDLISPYSGKSGKRFLAILIIVNVLGMCWYSVVKEIDIKESTQYIIITLVAGAFGFYGLTVADIKKKKDDTIN